MSRALSPEQISHAQALKSAAAQSVAGSIAIRAKAADAIRQADVAAAPAIHQLVEYAGPGPFNFVLPDENGAPLPAAAYKFRKVAGSNPPVYSVHPWSPSDPI